MSDKPLVSIITAAYNRADLIEETIESVLGQDYDGPIEYIVIDDGSSDNTLEIIKRYADRIRWDAHPNQGESYTVNKGFKMATGEIIGVVSSDDPLLPNAVRRLVETLTADPNLLVVYPDWNQIDLEGKVVEHVETLDYNYLEMISQHVCIPGPAAFFRRSVVERLEGRDQQFRYVADYDFWLRAGLLGPFARVPETLANFRVHPGSSTLKHRGERMALEHVRLLEKIYSLPNLPPEVLQVRREAFINAYHHAAELSDSAKMKRKMLTRALMCSPSKYFAGDYQNRLDDVLPIIFGRMHRVVGFAHRAWNSLNWKFEKLRKRARTP